MRAYVAIYSSRVRTLLQYRAAAVAGLATQVFWGLIRIMVLTAFYASTTAEPPLPLAQVVTYVWLTQGLLLLLPWGPDGDVAQMVSSGNLAYELLRPVDLYWAWYVRALAMRTAPVLIRAVPMIPFAILLGLTSPASVASGAAFCVAALGAVVLSAAFTTILTVSLPLTISGRGISVLTMGFVNLCSGIVLPLPLFPDSVRVVLEQLPFAGLLDFPLRLYLGNIEAGRVWSILAWQLAWAAGLIALGALLLAWVRRRIVIQGG